MIWIVLFFIIILISAVLAFRSMRDYEEFPDNLALNSLFYIGNPQALDEETLEKLHEVFSSQKQFFSLEKLYKGKERALVIFGPRQLIESFPELNLVEIEDYLDDSFAMGTPGDKKANLNETLTWLIRPKTAPKKQFFVGNELKDFKLGEKQQFFIQVICLPEQGKGGANFQSTIRIMAVEEDSIKRIELAKHVQQLFLDATGLSKNEDNFPEQKRFESFKQRSLIPKEVSEFPLNPKEIISLLG